MCRRIKEKMEESNKAELGQVTQRRLTSVGYWRFSVNAALTLLDMVMFCVASAVVINVRHEIDIYSFRFGFPINLYIYLSVCALIWAFCMHTAGIYHRHVMGDGYQLNVLLTKGAMFAAVMTCAFNFIMRITMSLAAIVLSFVFGLLLTMVERFIMRAVITNGRRKGRYSYATVVVGSPDGIEHALEFLAQKQQLNYRPVAICPIRLNPVTGLVEADDDISGLSKRVKNVLGMGVPIMTYSDDFAEHAVSLHAQTVMVTDVMYRFSDNFNTFALGVESMNLEIALVTSAVDISGHETQLRVIQGTTVMTICLPQYSPAAMLQKRIFDIVVSAVALVVIAVITVPVAIAIKLTDGGPVFYKQTRVGRRGKTFKMIKFRSMVVNADGMKAKLAQQTGQENRFIFKMENDPRITKVGRFIRRFSIDELPQFWNVFVGDMSLVGPRPPLPEEADRYNQLYATRMLVKPGITGPWQVSGRSNLSAEESEALDVGYVQSWSLSGDIVLLFRTVGAVLGQKGAY